MSPSRYGNRIALLRKRAKVSLRELSRKTNLAPATLSAIERGRSSPTIATLHKILEGLGTHFAAFFAGADGPGQSPVIRAAEARTVKDAQFTYSLLLPKRADAKFEMVRETHRPTKRKGEWSLFDFDVGGIVMDGGPFVLEIAQQGQWTLDAGDAFYIPAGAKHRGMNRGKDLIHLVTVCCPPRY